MGADECVAQPLSERPARGGFELFVPLVQLVWAGSHDQQGKTNDGQRPVRCSSFCRRSRRVLACCHSLARHGTGSPRQRSLNDVADREPVGVDLASNVPETPKTHAAVEMFAEILEKLCVGTALDLRMKGEHVERAAANLAEIDVDQA